MLVASEGAPSKDFAYLTKTNTVHSKGRQMFGDRQADRQTNRWKDLNRYAPYHLIQ